MELTIKELLDLVGGDTKEKLDEEIVITTISPIEEAKEGAISFLYLKSYNQYLKNSNATVVLVNKNFIPESNEHPPLIYVDDVKKSLMLLINKFKEIQDYKSGIEEPVYISKDVKYGNNVYIGAFAYLGKGVRIGNNVKIYPNTYIGDDVKIDDNSIIYAGVKIYNRSEIGKNCILHSGCIIGGDGFGHAPQQDGSYKKIPQIGNVIIKDNVEVGANTTIDRASIESTIINKGVKLDNLIMIAHNVEIGENTVVVAQTGISGSTKIGKRCILAGQSGFVGHISIADGSQFGAKSGVSKSIKEENQQWFGVPLMKVRESLKMQVLLRNLPDLFSQIKEIKNELLKIKSEKSNNGK